MIGTVSESSKRFCICADQDYEERISAEHNLPGFVMDLVTGQEKIPAISMALLAQCRLKNFSVNLVKVISSRTSTCVSLTYLVAKLSW